ncbi:hypothetical protein M413DRAFT_63480, partial [Hebeloma cylindrosporum]
RELMIMDMLRAHPHVIDLLGAAWSDVMLCIITPWMENGTIGQFLSRNSPDVYQIVDAMKFLKQSDIIHGDIKGDNILIDSSGNASIIDFGLSFISGPRLTLSGISNPGAGTIRWMAPERLYPEEWGKGQATSTFESEIYSLGMVLYEIYSGNIPFEGSTNSMVVVFVFAGLRPSRPTLISDDMWHLTERCWHANPSLRPEIATIFEDLNHRQLESSVQG